MGIALRIRLLLLLALGALGAPPPALADFQVTGAAYDLRLPDGWSIKPKEVPLWIVGPDGEELRITEQAFPEGDAAERARVEKEGLDTVQSFVALLALQVTTPLTATTLPDGTVMHELVGNLVGIQTFGQYVLVGNRAALVVVLTVAGKSTAPLDTVKAALQAVTWK